MSALVDMRQRDGKLMCKIHRKKYFKQGGKSNVTPPGVATNRVCWQSFIPLLLLTFTLPREKCHHLNIDGGGDLWYFILVGGEL